MDRVLQILAVFVLLMLLISRSIRGREERFRRFSYLARVRPPLAAEVMERLIAGVFGAGGEAHGVALEADAFLWDEDRRMLLLYRLDGKLTINRRMAGGR